MALILSVLIFCALEYNKSFHTDASGSKFGFFSSFLVIKKMGTSGEGTKFQCKVWPIFFSCNFYWFCKFMSQIPTFPSVKFLKLF